MRQMKRVLPLFSVCILLAACGGGGGGGGGDGSSGGGSGADEFDVKVTFPTPGANLGGGTEEITVSGRLTGVSNADDVNFVDVNTNFAVLDSEDPTIWSHEALDVGGHANLTYTVTAESTSGGMVETEHDLDNQFLAEGVGHVAADPSNNRMFLLSNSLPAVLAMNLDTGDVTTISGQGLGSGDELVDPKSISVDLSGGRIFVVDQVLDTVSSESFELIEVDIATGDRNTLAEELGDEFWGTNTFDAARNRILLVAGDSDGNFIYEVNPDNGDLNVFANSGIHRFDAGAALDPDNGRLLQVDGTSIRAVDLGTGNSVILSDNNTGTGPDYGSLAAVVVDSANNRAFVLDVLHGLGGGGAVFEVDLATGNRVVISANGTQHVAESGSGTLMGNPVVITRDPDSGEPLVWDTFYLGLIGIDSASGDRQLFARSQTGRGPGFAHAGSLKNARILSINDEVLVMEPRGITGALYAVNIRTGARRIVSGPDVGSGPPLSEMHGMAVDEVNTRMFVAGRSESDEVVLLSIDLSSGDRTVISGGGKGDGPSFQIPNFVAYDRSEGRVFVGENKSGAGLVFEVDISTGDRSVFLSDNVAADGDLAPAGMDIDQAERTLLVGDHGAGDTNDWLILVDLDSGGRSVVGIAFSDMQPRSLRLDLANNRALAFELGTEEIVTIDLDSGFRDFLHNNLDGSGPRFWKSSGMALDAANNRAYLIGADKASLVVANIHADAPTKDRAVVSRARRRSN